MTPIKYLWRLHGEAWERIFDKIITNAKTIKSVHERFLGKNNNLQGRPMVPRYRKNGTMDKRQEEK